MKKIYLLLILALFVANTFATNTIPSGEAQKVAESFLTKKMGITQLTFSDFKLQHTETDANGEAVFYRFQVGEKGFILISATNLATPVLAYSLETNYSDNEATKYFSEKYKNEIAYVKQNPVTAMPNAKQEWANYSALISKNESKADSTDADSIYIAKYVEPLVTTKWNQDKYYNQYCPYDVRSIEGYDFRAANGCVALTMINIMNYHRYPNVGVLGVGYKSQYGNLEANFAKSSYNYDAITDVLDNYEGEFGKLVYHCGISVLMNYGPPEDGGSGAQTPKSLEVLQKNWKFSPAASLRDRSAYTSYQQWVDEVVFPELDAHRPIYYSGQSKEGGHAWILDGYVTYSDSTSYFHVNWGWAGTDNGFYLIDNLNSSSSGSFSNSESAMVNLVPADPNATNKPDTSFVRNTAAAGSISDGAGDKKYAKKSYREWMIATPNASAYTFSFSKIRTEKDHDYIIIYDGPTKESGEKIRLSGNYLMPASSDYVRSTGSHQTAFDLEKLPGNVRVDKDSVLVVFVSDDNDITDYGFTINYKATHRNSPTCNATPKTTEWAEGLITDKSADILLDLAGNDLPEGNYRAQTACQWRVNGTYITGYAFAFYKFDLKAGDFVDIFDYANRYAPRLLYRFDVNNSPDGTYYINDATSLLIKFNSDNWLEGEGFQLKYYSIASIGIDENAGLRDVKVFPNPASNYVTVELMSDAAENVQIQIMDMTGRTISAETVSHSGGEFQYTTPVNQLTSGIYMLRIQTAKGQVNRKFIVE